MPIAPQPVLRPLFFTRREYFLELTRRIAATNLGDRVLLTTMAFDANDQYVQSIFDALAAAAKRGVSVWVAIDAYDFIRGEKFMGPLWWNSRMPNSAKLRGLASRNFRTIQQVRDAGGTCTIVNAPRHPFSNPFTGRSHIKCAVVNTFSFVGGCNLHQNKETDCMIGLHDAKTADWLFNTLQPLVALGANRSAFGLHDKHFSMQSGVDFLLDAGVKRQSTILQNAYQVIDNARSWIFLSCQYFPNSTTTQRLRAAYARGVKVYLLLNDVSKHRGVHIPIQRVVTPLEKMRSPESFFNFVLPAKEPYMHAKVLATETTAIVGSHNYILAGVNFGTAELAVRWQDSLVSHQLVQCLLDQTSFAHNPAFSFLR